jgi:hypothetical protein
LCIFFIAREFKIELLHSLNSKIDYSEARLLLSHIGERCWEHWGGKISDERAIAQSGVRWNVWRKAFNLGDVGLVCDAFWSENCRSACFSK